MRNLLIVATLFVALVSPALASDPGQPLDCSDWVFLEPGHTCVEVMGGSAGTSVAPFNTKGRSLVEVQPDGGLLALRYGECPDPPQNTCGIWVTCWRILRWKDGAEETIAYANERCVDDQIRTADKLGVVTESHSCQPGGACQENSDSGYLTLDSVNGILYVPVNPYCKQVGEAWCRDVPNYNTRLLLKFDGFSTLYEIQHTYDVTEATWGFRVPAIPSGLESADNFDTYWGSLATVGDWSQAQPLQCAYPLSPPEVGAYLTVTDTLPTPEAGQGYYYVTAVTYQGATRHGRKCANGVLSGRDPAVLPECVE